MATLDHFLPRTRIAYFSMEIAIAPEIKTYAGGLGVLAGDTARSAADLELPMVFVTLASREGYLRQDIDADGGQVGQADPWVPDEHCEALDAMVAVRIEGRPVWVRPWLHVVTCPVGHQVPVLLLDTNVDHNAAEDRAICDRLYGGDEAHRLKQEIVLGIGGVRLLAALGFAIRTYHMNEGHAALLALDLLRRHPVAANEPGQGALRYDLDPVRDMCVFTTHTPVEAGHDRFGYGEVARALGDDAFDLDQLRVLAGQDALNMTRLALNLSGYVNGVAARHAETARRMFPGYGIRAITNGVHVPTWAHTALASLFQTVAPDWGHDPSTLIAADTLDDAAVWAAHEAARADLVAEVERRGGTRLDPDLPILGFARRMTGYKRPDLLFSDLGRLRALHRAQPFQVVMAGKAHPADTGGNELIRQLNAHVRDLSGEIPMAFLPGYDMALAKMMVAGADIWLNTPLPPMEASGTSGIKAAVNGVLNLSVLDGWWVEGCIEGVTGWAIGADGGDGSDHAQALYAKLESTVLPLWHGDRGRWIWMMKQSISKIGARFNSQAMMRRYASEAYLR